MGTFVPSSSRGARAAHHRYVTTHRVDAVLAHQDARASGRVSGLLAPCSSLPLRTVRPKVHNQVMWEVPRFRMPEGAEVVERQGDDYRIRVSIPVDEDGFLGRACPECELLFRMDAADYDGLPDELMLWCVYCGHHDEHSEFMTSQQRDRIMRAAEEFGAQLVLRQLDKTVGSLARRSRRNSPISISYTAKPHYPRPLPDVDEERLLRVRTCTSCQVKYAVFGEHRYCPVCGQLPAATVALDALQADTARLDALDAIPPEAKALLREQGVFTRSWVDTIENVVGTVEALSSSLYRSSVPDADTRLRGKGNIFQRLDDMADLYVAAGYPDLRRTLDPVLWQRLTTIWATRHAFTHNDGLVDQKYLAKVPTSAARIGQRLTVSDVTTRRAIDDATILCRAIVQTFSNAITSSQNPL